nr:uncharacterized protein K02A2.6-like [Onthophagus taurus]
MRLLKFNYRIEYGPGKSFHVPDALSRAPLQQGTTDLDALLMDEVYISSVIKEVDGFVLKERSEKNKIRRWKKKTLKPIDKEILIYKDRLVIPKTLRKRCLNLLHDGHFGMGKCKARAKQSLWWPGIHQQIDEMIHNCEICLQTKPTAMEPMISREISGRPCWSRFRYVVIQDYYSKYPEVRKLTSIKSRDIIEVMKDVFARHGIPDVVRSDNGPQVNWQFAEKYGFKWTSSSPEYRQSNGLDESAVKTLKTILKRSLFRFFGVSQLNIDFSRTAVVWTKPSRQNTNIEKQIKSEITQS